MGRKYSRESNKSNNVVKPASSLRYRDRFKDMLGKKFGRLLVKEFLGFNSSRRSVWLCDCDCGKEAKAAGEFLRSGSKASCGCLTTERMRKHAKEYCEKNTLPKEVLTANSKYASYKCGAKNRGIMFALDKEEFSSLIKQDCFYCGAAPMNRFDGGGQDRIVFYNGLDRVDSDIGYISDNVVTCCIQCNTAKLDFTQKEFLSWIRRVYEKTYGI